MFDPLAMIIADHATKQQVLSARPDAPTTPDRSPRQRGDTMRRLAVAALLRLADRIEPHRTDRRCVTTSVPAS
jgi:hypothetical protein